MTKFLTCFWLNSGDWELVPSPTSTNKYQLVPDFIKMTVQQDMAVFNG